MEAHKIRNNIVHNDYDIDQDEALETFNTYNLSIRKILNEEVSKIITILLLLFSFLPLP